MTPGFPESLFTVMAEILGAELHLMPDLSGPAAGEDPFADGTFDFGWICSTSYVDLTTGRPEPSVRLAGVAWVPDDPDSGGEPVYFSDIVVAADSGIRNFDDLAGRRIACNDAVSLSGHHALRLEINRRGADPDAFAELIFTGGHQRSLDMITDGAIEAAVIDSVVRFTRARVDPAVADLKIIEHLGPWPVQPLVARIDLPKGVVVAAANRLLSASLSGPLATELKAAGFAGLVRVGPENYETVRQALAAIH